MTGRGKVWLAEVLFVIVLLELAVSLTFAAMSAALPVYSFAEAFPLGDLGSALGLLVVSVLGVLLASRQPDNAIGWLMLAIGLLGVEPAWAWAIVGGGILYVVLAGVISSSRRTA
jgi:hypothetical protein